MSNGLKWRWESRGRPIINLHPIEQDHQTSFTLAHLAMCSQGPRMYSQDLPQSQGHNKLSESCWMDEWWRPSILRQKERWSLVFSKLGAIEHDRIQRDSEGRKPYKGKCWLTPWLSHKSCGMSHSLEPKVFLTCFSEIQNLLYFLSY